jgi:hypothetical protein
MKYRKKPVVIDAWRIPFDSDDATSEIPAWVVSAMTNGSLDLIDADHKVSINTLEGKLTANQGDWLIRGVKGELYACKPDIFELTYEPA